MATDQWIKNFFSNDSMIKLCGGPNSPMLEGQEKEEEHMLPCPNCGEDYEEMELKPDNICPKCLFKENP